MPVDPDPGYVGPADSPDRYQLISRRAAGGEGEVWQAQERHGTETFSYAVKLIRIDDATLADRQLEDLRLQAALATHLEHAALVKVKEVFVGAPPHAAGEAGTEGRRLYFVMKWIEGTSLQEAMEQGQIRGLGVLQTLSGIADAIDYLHSGRDTNGAPVIHRDIKPANMLLSSDGRVYLVDFGLVRLRSTNQTSRIFGTAPFMAPESLARGEYTPASDRYTFGASVYYVLTGETPIPGDIDGMTQRLANALGPGREREIRGILTMLSVQPDARPASCARWIQALATAPMQTSVGQGPVLPMTEAASSGGIASGSTPPASYPMPPGSFASPVSTGAPAPASVGATPGPASHGPASGPATGGPISGSPYPVPQLSPAAGGFIGAPPPRKKGKVWLPLAIVGGVVTLLMAGCCYALAMVPKSGGGYGASAQPTRSFDRSQKPPLVTALQPAMVTVGDIAAVLQIGRDNISESSDSGLQGGLTELALCSNGEPIPATAIGSVTTNRYYASTEAGYENVSSAVAGLYAGEAAHFFKTIRETAGGCGWSELQIGNLGDETYGIFADDGTHGKVAIVFVRKGKVILELAVTTDSRGSYQADAINIAKRAAQRIPKS
ncbi:MAG: protein kinase domain-containing protein [Micromonosporaceae bacterium]